MKNVWYNTKMEKIYDVLILGGGVAGMTAALYATRRGKNVAIIEKFALGGQVALLNRIENFPSQKEIDGISLTKMFEDQVKNLQIQIIFDDIKRVDFSGEKKVLISEKKYYKSKSVIVATGLSSVELGINENDFWGRGVSYCAVCDANFYKGQKVCVASKRGSGIKSALELAEVCSKVIVLDSEDLSKYAAASKNPKVEIISNVQIQKIAGEYKLEKVFAEVNGEEEVFETPALFIDLGKKPKTELFNGVLDLDEKGYIKTDENMHTSVKNVFAVGDVRNGFLKQIVTACSDGAIAGQLC